LSPGPDVTLNLLL